jgi:hypothetical protein
LWSYNQWQQQPIKNPHPKTSGPLSARLLHPVEEKEVEQQFLGGGHDIVIREACVPASLNNLGKAAVLHPALFCSWGHAKLSLLIIGHSCAYVRFSQASHNLFPTSDQQLCITSQRQAAFCNWHS